MWSYRGSHQKGGSEIEGIYVDGIYGQKQGTEDENVGKIRLVTLY
jgi:hypothetical protein